MLLRTPVTEQRILVPDAGRRSMKNARAMIDVLPQGTSLGPATGVWRSAEFPSGKVWMHRRFCKDVQAADMVIASAVNGKPGIVNSRVPRIPVISVRRAFLVKNAAVLDDFLDSS